MAARRKQKRKANGPGAPSTRARKPAQATPRAHPRRPRHAPLVVGMVASAGGLDAFKRFLQAMPTDSGMAFVLVPHLDPKRESLMAPLLAKYTSMPLAEATEGARLEPNRVWVIPPNRYLSVRAGALRLSGPTDGAGAPAIDAFLRSLAEDQREHAACVVLSGTGSYGSLGLKAVKSAGGLAMVQDPNSAEYGQMPQSAANTGLADYVLPVEQMPKALAVYAQHLQFGGGEEPEEHVPLPDALNGVIGVLRARTQFDFRFYRKRMLLRRVQRRMALLHLQSLEDYVTMLRERPEELKLLAKDLLISVTSFFRDPEVFQILATQVAPPLLEARADGEPVRVWVPGCATGEEAYSIAMLFLEQMARVRKEVPLQIFATDVDTDALEVARRGVYPRSIASDVGKERLERFFTKLDEHSYQITRQLRDAVMFAPQNLLSDAPFSRLDLVSCRNVLIYLEPGIQEKVIGLLHFALKPEGYLLLGPSETLGKAAGEFRTLSKKWRLYQRGIRVRPARVDFPIAGASARAEAQGPRLAPPRLSVTLEDHAQRMLLEEYAPAAVLTNRDYEALSYWGPMERYLRQRSGAPTQDITRLAREGMGARIRAAVQKALSSGQRVSLSGARTRYAGRAFAVRVAARPLRIPRAGEALVLLTFHDETRSRARRSEAPPRRAEESLVQQLEHELKSSREELQGTIEEMESANEELKASNEEVMSMNEELQSANEELETSKEELQSVNEELGAVNSQLQEKVDQVVKTSDDLQNLLASAEVLAVFLRADGRIERYTPAATRLFNLIASDIGRPLRHITRAFEDDTLEADIEAVMRDLAVHEREIVTADERWYVRRARPYRTHDNRIGGVVLAFNDITSLKRAEQELRHLADSLELRVDQRTEALRTEVAQRDLAEQRSSAQAAELLRVYRVHTAGALAASVAHELNQPLAAIASYCEASLKALRSGEQPSEKLIRNVEQALVQTQRAAGVIRELRSFLAQEVGDGNGFTELNDTVRTARHLLSLEAQAVGVSIELELAEDLKPCRGARVPIEHVLVNLVRNSIEAMKAAGVKHGRVRITTHMVESGVHVTVADNGPGLSAEFARSLFDAAFFSTRAQAQGMGMGLSVCRSIVSSYGGEIWADPPKGAGAIIHFTLPLA